MCEYLVHYDENGNKQLIKEHLTGVAQLACTEGAKIGIGQMAWIVAILHDMGKFQDDFQEYIRSASRAEQKGKIDHSSAGAEFLFGLFRGAERNKDVELLRELLSYAIFAHHGVFDMVNQEEHNNFDKRLKKVEKSVLQDIYMRWSEDMHISMEYLQKCIMLTCGEYQTAFLNNFNEVRRQNREEYLFYAGCLTRLLLSIQIDADWSDTGATMHPDVQKNVSEAGEVFEQAWKNYEHYMETLKNKSAKKPVTPKEQEINILREQIREECLKFTRQKRGIYCLSIPTGAGKTLTSLGYALKYAKEHLVGSDAVEHIFYISPYISITEQNAQVIKEAVGNGEWVLEHHSNVSNSDDRDSDFETAWDEYFICTTMVQFLNALFSNKKKSIRRFHKLKRSIVILDEIQSLPIKTLHTFNLMMNFLAKVCHTDIILCTATQPELDSIFIKRKIQYASPRNMIEDLSMRFAQFERVEIKYCQSSQQGMETESIESLIESVAKEFLRVQSVLVILNKKQTVAEFYDRTKEELSDVAVYYLTTNLCAEHRRNRICEIKEELRRREKKILVVSTNLIEAGVDLSVECVYRSLAGIDSIAQAAGRCNRNGELTHGTVYVFELEGDEPGRNMDELLVAQQKTKEIIYCHAKKETEESILFPEWMKQYYEAFYEELKGKMDFSLKEEYRGESIFGLLSTGFSDVRSSYQLSLAFQTAGEQYQVIADTGVTVIVPYKEGANLAAILDECEGKWEMGKLRKHMRSLQPYTVSVYHYKKEELLQKGVIRACRSLPEVYIAVGYQEEKGLVDLLPDAIF